MGTFLFGLARPGVPAGYGDFSVQISRIRCSQCNPAQPCEYIAWADRNATDTDKQEVTELLTRLLEGDHPDHRPDRYEGMTLPDLRLKCR